MADRRVWVTYEFEKKFQWAEVKCGGCGWRVVFPEDSVTALFPQPMPLRQAEKRFRCRRCGKRVATMRGVARREYHG